MTVSTLTTKISYNCNGSQTAFPFDFKILAKDDLEVILRDSNGNDITLVRGSHYTVNAGPWEEGGTVTTIATYASGNTLVIAREMPQTQQVDYTKGDSFPAETHEEALDRVVMLVQETIAKLARTLMLSKASGYSDLDLPDPVAGKYLAWKDDLSGIKNVELQSQGNLTVTDFIKTVLDDETAAAARVTLGVSSMANVKAYPYLAKGDGVTDDTTAIQAALNDNPGIWFPEGTYISGLLTHTGERILDGIGPKSILKLKDNTNDHLLKNAAVGNALITIKNLKLDGNRANNAATSAGVYYDRAGRVMLENVWITEFNDFGAYFTNCNAVGLRDVFVNECGKGVYCTDNALGGSFSMTGRSVIETCDTCLLHIISSEGTGFVAMIMGGWFESDDEAPTDHVIIDAQRVTMIANTFNGLSATNSIINLLTGSKYCFVAANRFRNAPSNHPILVDSGAKHNIFMGNYGGAPCVTDNDGGNYIFEYDSAGDYLIQKGRIAQPIITFADGDTTPSVAGGNHFRTGSSSAIDITTLDDGKPGQIVFIDGMDGGNSTFKHNTSYMYLAGGADFTLGNRDTLVLRFDGYRWVEFSRSDNAG